MTALHTILMIEDEKLVRQTLRDLLQRQDFLVFEAANGQRGLDILDQYNVDIILVDLSLPDMDGVDLIQKVKAKTNAMIIVLSGEKKNDRKVQTFENGADDFIEKPYDPALLIAKIKAHTRRLTAYDTMPLNGHPHAALPDNPQVSIKIENWTLDRMKFQLFDDKDNSADLTSREFFLLDFLVANAGRAIPREELCEAVREENYIPTPRAVDVKVTRIRKKIGDDAANPHIIQTIRGVGYMFNKELINDDTPS